MWIRHSTYHFITWLTIGTLAISGHQTLRFIEVPHFRPL